MDRIYSTLITEHLTSFPQMLFLAGPRQVGKTTIAMMAEKYAEQFNYLSWDIDSDREQILQGNKALGEALGYQQANANRRILVLDEIHKFTNWKNYLKGFYDLYKDQATIIVTGSAKLNLYQKQADSLMGRYFLYRIHPISVGECLHPSPLSEDQLFYPPKEINSKHFEDLCQYGGFPQPFIKANNSFYNRWKLMRSKQLFNEDIRELSNIHEITQLELLATLLKGQIGQLSNLSKLANKINIAETTVKRWIATLENFYYCFQIKPWSKNINRSLLKQPKIYLWDWSLLSDKGARNENIIASHLLKSIQYWNDTGRGEFDLFFIRDKDKNEVDFLVTKEQQPWILVEVKSTDNKSISSSLHKFQQQLKAPYAFQIAFDLPFTSIDCLKLKKPMIIPAKTFLSQLI